MPLLRPSQEYGVPPAGVRAGAAVLDLHLESGAGEESFEGRIGGSGPERNASAGLERGAHGLQSGVVVETVVGARGQRGRPIIDIEEDGVEAGEALSNDVGDVLLEDCHPPVGKGDGSERVERVTIPGDDGGQDFGHLNGSIGGEASECRFQGEAEAQASDQHTRRGFRFQVGAS